MDKIVKTFRFIHCCDSVIQKCDCKNNFKKSPPKSGKLCVCVGLLYKQPSMRDRIIKTHTYTYKGKNSKLFLTSDLCSLDQYVASESASGTAWVFLKGRWCQKGTQEKSQERKCGIQMHHKNSVVMCRISSHLDGFHQRAAKKPLLLLFFNAFSRMKFSDSSFPRRDKRLVGGEGNACRREPGAGAPWGFQHPVTVLHYSANGPGR